MALSKKRRAFVAEYCKDFNGTQAAIRAGYSERSAHVTASRLLKDDKVSGAIEEAINERMMDADEAMLLLSDIARGDIGDVMAIGSMGFTLDMEEARKQGLTKLIKKIKQKTTTYLAKKESDEDRQIENLEVELYAADSALRDILKVHGRFSDRLDITSGGEPLKIIVEYAND